MFHVIALKKIQQFGQENFKFMSLLVAVVNIHDESHLVSSWPGFIVMSML